jgi:hypothetical protein
MRPEKKKSGAGTMNLNKCICLLLQRTNGSLREERLKRQQKSVLFQ